ncbi:hypothetical protein DUI87_06375 [Hirundo rustica rustica]|uniref:Core shell protein Gag P30 domain-containing protein n=1 Tax=Hirundo rustica rustica TaxID=333673 RepID=A0A3M0KVR7_HIRRU|nr:hypothetical protein DUI87_06375 [Hirundo rustica rustica]
MANPEQRPIGDVSVPLNTGDVREFKKEIGRLLEDPLGVAERLDQFLCLNIYIWVELQSILGILFTMEEREMIRHSGMWVWDRECQGPDQGDQKWPMQDPGWNNQNERHRQNMSDLQWMIIQGIPEAVPKSQNTGKALSEHQGKDEALADWLETLRKALQLYSGVDPDTASGQIESDKKFGLNDLVLIPEADNNSLGEVLIIALRIKIAPCERKLKIYSLTEEENFEISDTVWYTDEVRKLNIQPISTEIQNPEIPFRVKQYPIALEGQKGLKLVVENSVHQGVLESCVSPHNTPILPVKKPDGSYRLVQDLRAVNQRTITRFPGVAKPDTS